MWPLVKLATSKILFDMEYIAAEINTVILDNQNISEKSVS
jgi:hypothetical protein